MRNRLSVHVCVASFGLLLAGCGSNKLTSQADGSSENPRADSQASGTGASDRAGTGVDTGGGTGRGTGVSTGFGTGFGVSTLTGRGIGTSTVTGTAFGTGHTTGIGDTIVTGSHTSRGTGPGIGSSTNFTTSSSTSTGGAIDAGAVGPIASMPAATAAQCQQPLGERLAVNTIAGMRAILVGDWALCSGPGIAFHAQAGITITSNDRWAFMVWSGDRLTTLAGPNNSGSVEYFDSSEMNGRPTIQVDFVTDQGTSVTIPVISDQPRMMVIASDPAPPAIYLAMGQTGDKADGGATDSAGATSAIAISRTAAAELCQQPRGQNLPVSSIADAQALLRGAWALCSEVGIFSRAQGGITIKPNNRWAYLAWSGNQLTVLTGLDNQGSVEYLASSDMGGSPTVQVNFFNDLGFMLPVFPAISDQPRMMTIASGSGASMIYAQVQ